MSDGSPMTSSPDRGTSQTEQNGNFQNILIEESPVPEECSPLRLPSYEELVSLNLSFITVREKYPDALTL